MEDFYYSDRYQDDMYEYRHVILPRRFADKIPANRLLSEAEWRRLGVQQSLGWQHYEHHRPEPHILLFRRPIDFSKKDEEAAKEMLMKEMDIYERKWGRK